MTEKNRAEKRREVREISKGLDPKQKAYLDMVQSNAKKVSERLMEFREELAEFGYQAVPVIQATSQGITPHLEIQPLSYEIYIKLKELRETGKPNKDAATKEEDKTIESIDENVKEEVPVYPH